MEKIDKLNVLYRNKVIKEMTLEDLEIWKGFKEIYPSCLRFPESVEWSLNGKLRYRNNVIKETKTSLKLLNGYIKEIMNSNIPRGKRDVEFFNKQERILKIHLKNLKDIRNKRLNEKLDIPFKKNKGGKK